MSTDHLKQRRAALAGAYVHFAQSAAKLELTAFESEKSARQIFNACKMYFQCTLHARIEISEYRGLG